jgi:hypothetical protein
MSADEAERYLRQLIAEQREQREKHEAKITRGRPIVKGQELSTIEILQHLAIAKLSHEPDSPYAEIPAALIDAIAIAIAGARLWHKTLAKLKASNDERESRAAKRRRAHRAEADRLRAAHPHISDRAVAVIIAKATGARAPTIRRHIKKN